MINNSICVRPIRPSDAPRLAAGFAEQGWFGKDEAQFLRYEREQRDGLREVFVAELDGEVAGYVTLLPEAPAGAFAHRGIPEICDFNVLMKYRRRGVGSRLLDAAEASAFRRADRVCLGVGLHSGYGAAQRMYIRRGYQFDGTGAWYQDENIGENAPCRNDDDLILYLSKPRPATFPLPRQQMLSIVRRHLAGHLGCDEALLNGEGLLFHGRKGDPEPFLEIASIGRAVIASASDFLLPEVRALLEGRFREEVFECPWVYGQSIYYIPDEKTLKPLPLPPGYEYHLAEGEALRRLNGLKGFPNSLAFDEEGNTPTCIVFYAAQDGEIVGLAGASGDHDDMWEMGVDVRADRRTGGLASALVSHLAVTILQKGVLPIYCAASSNIASQAVAHRAGLSPCWVSTYRTALDGSCAYDGLIRKCHLKEK